MTTTSKAATQPAPGSRAHFLSQVIDGLSASQKTLPTSYLYDARGSALFEDITRLDDYYPTRTEIKILRACAREWAANLRDETVLVEFGSGSSEKTELLLADAPKITGYAPIDVSPAALEGGCVRLESTFPALDVIPVVGDFRTAALPAQFHGRPLAGFFPGSTIGNLTPVEARELLRSFAAIIQTGNQLLIGVDLVKDRDELIAAYDDARGVTADFNLNLLTRINRELAANFELSNFAHLAKFDPVESRIEMHLVSKIDQTVGVDGRHFDFAEGETIHTENSYKYTLGGFKQLANEGGWETVQVWTDPDRKFSVHGLVAS